MELIDVPQGQIGTWRLGTGPPALVIHGGPGLSDYTQGLAEELAGQFETVRYQQRGLPPTTLKDPYTVESHIADAIDLLDALKIKRAWAIGHSWGGHLAMHLAVAHPERLLGLIVVDCLGAIDDGGEDEFERRISERLAPADVKRAQELDERAMRGEGTEEDALESLRIVWPTYFAHPETAAPMPPIRLSVKGYAETFASVREHLGNGTLQRGLPAYRGPACFVHGKEDPLPHRVSLESATLIDGATVRLLDDCGHFPWIEKPGAIRRALTQLKRF